VDPYARAYTGFNYENTKMGLNKQKKTRDIIREFSNKEKSGRV
jgi:hypothetical protein